MLLSAGTKLGPYEVVGPIGAGAMGEVYKARDIRLDRAVAVKILPESFASDSVRLHRFEQEGRVIAALDHPNIVAVHDIGSLHGRPYLVTELLEGKSLRDHLSDGPIPVRKAVQYATEMAEALAAAHDRGIIHRDLKPENIFITSKGRVKVLDFGLARAAVPVAQTDSDDATRTRYLQTDPGVVMGTAGYMSPEQVKGRLVDHRSDIFSFGAVLYEMLTGKRAFHGESSVETMNAILKEDPPEILSDSSIPPALERIVRHCLEKDPKHRFESAHDLAFGLATLSSLSDSTVRTTAAFPLKSRRRMVIVAGAVAALAIAGIALLALSLKAPSPLHYQKLTFRRGYVSSARFAPDQKTVIYSAAWSSNPVEIFSTLPESPESRPLGLNDADVLSVSSQRELAILLKPQIRMNGFIRFGTLARLNMSGSSSPREIAEDIESADWSPDGHNIAVLRYAGGTHSLEYPIGKVLYQSSDPIWLSNVRISRNGRLIAFLEHYGEGDDRGRVVVFDTGGTEKFRSKMWDGTAGVAWVSDDRLWVAATVPESTRRQLFDVKLDGTVRLVMEVPGELTVQDVSRDGVALVTTNERRIVISALADGRLRDLSWLDRSILDGMSGDGSTILFHEGGQGGGALGSTYIRKLDGSPPVRLSDGYAVDLSADGKWVLTFVPVIPPEYRLVPTGVGDPKTVTPTGITNPRPFGFLRSQSGLLWLGDTPDNKGQMYTTALDGGNAQPIGPRGFIPEAVSRNGQLGIVKTPEGLQLWDYSSGSGTPVRGIAPDENVLSLDNDGKSVYLIQTARGPRAIFVRLDLKTGKREPIAELSGHDMDGVVGLNRALVTPDGKTIVFSYVRHLSELYMVHGVK